MECTEIAQAKRDVVTASSTQEKGNLASSSRLTETQTVSNFEPSGDNGKTKARKPYTITKQRERWTDEEHMKFLEALRLYGRAWRKIEEYIGSKTAVQIRSHAQKFFCKLERKKETGEIHQVEPIDIPPPRPKRKPSRPYPRKENGDTSGNGDVSGNNGQGSSGNEYRVQQSNVSSMHTYNKAKGMPSSELEVTEATVAAVAAAASAAAAAAAAAVVAAAGQQVQAHLQNHPPQGFPFFGLPPSLLGHMSALQSPALEVLAQAAHAPSNTTSHRKGGLDQERTPQGALVEATATTDGTRVSGSDLTRGSDGDSACSRETDREEESEEPQQSWPPRNPKQDAYNAVPPPQWTLPPGWAPQHQNGLENRSSQYWQILGLLEGLKPNGANQNMIKDQKSARKLVSGASGSSERGKSFSHKEKGFLRSEQQEVYDDRDESPGYSENMQEAASPSVKEDQGAASAGNESGSTSGSASDDTDGSRGAYKTRKARRDLTASRDARGSNFAQPHNGSGHGSNGNGNGSSGNGNSGSGNNGDNGHNGNGSSGNRNGSSGNGNGSSGNDNSGSGNGNGNGSSGNGTGGSSGNGNGHSVKDSNNGREGNGNGYSSGEHRPGLGNGTSMVGNGHEGAGTSHPADHRGMGGGVYQSKQYHHHHHPRVQYHHHNPEINGSRVAATQAARSEEGRCGSSELEDQQKQSSPQTSGQGGGDTSALQAMLVALQAQASLTPFMLHQALGAQPFSHPLQRTLLSAGLSSFAGIDTATFSTPLFPAYHSLAAAARQQMPNGEAPPPSLTQYEMFELARVHSLNMSRAMEPGQRAGGPASALQLLQQELMAPATMRNGELGSGAYHLDKLGREVVNGLASGKRTQHPSSSNAAESISPVRKRGTQ